MEQFPRVHRLPPYVFAQVNELKMKMRHQGADIVDLGMGNPDLPTPQHIVEKLMEAIIGGFEEHFSCLRSCPAGDELELMQSLRKEKYLSDSWTFRR